MSKELEALKYLKENKRRHWLEGDKSNECLDVIETALKRLEKLEKSKEIVGTTTVDKALEQFLIDSCPEVKKKLKALDIIKEYPFVVQFIQTNQSYSDLAITMPNTEIPTKEEYKILKEILK